MNLHPVKKERMVQPIQASLNWYEYRNNSSLLVDSVYQNLNYCDKPFDRYLDIVTNTEWLIMYLFNPLPVSVR